MTDSSLLSDYPVHTEIEVAWGEMDALQHVNNAVYFRYFETARIDYCQALDLMKILCASNIGPVVSETSCRYKLPVTFPDTLVVGSRIIEVKDDRFTMEYAVLSRKHQAISTLGKATIVMFDFKTGHKAPLPQSVIEHIDAVESRSNR